MLLSPIRLSSWSPPPLYEESNPIFPIHTFLRTLNICKGSVYCGIYVQFLSVRNALCHPTKSGQAKEVQKVAQAKAQATLSNIFSGIKRKKTYVSHSAAGAAAKPSGAPGAAAAIVAAAKPADNVGAAAAAAATAGGGQQQTAAAAAAAASVSSLPAAPPVPKGPVHLKVVDLIGVMSADPQLNKTPLLYTWQAQESFREYNRESVAR